MQVMPLEVYASDSNYAVVKPPGRNFPGCVIQGDSLRILCRSAQAVARHVKDGTTTEQDCLEHIDDLLTSLVGRLLHYQTVLRDHGIQLPYTGEVTENDLVKLSTPNPDAPFESN